MRAVVINEYGGIDQLQPADISEPEPGPGQIKVRVRAAGINPVDWKQRKGQLRWVVPLRFPAVLGRDFSGEVTALGPGVSEFSLGEAVYGMSDTPAGLGTYAEQTVVSASAVAPKPAELSFEDAAALPLAALTALRALRDIARVREGQEILINGVSGGVGLFGLQIARALGARVVGVCSERNEGFIRGMGAERTLNHRKGDPFAGSARYDVVFDAVAKGSYSRAKGCLRGAGVYVTTLPSAGILFQQLVGNAVSSRKGYLVNVRPSGEDLRTLSQWVAQRKLRAEVEAVYPLEELRAAHARSESGKVRGKLVVRIGEG